MHVDVQIVLLEDVPAMQRIRMNNKKKELLVC
jgi:hypothetical protein